MKYQKKKLRGRTYLKIAFLKTGTLSVDRVAFIAKSDLLYVPRYLLKANTRESFEKFYILHYDDRIQSTYSRCGNVNMIIFE